MPELPEVETTLRGISPQVLNKEIAGVQVRHWQLRWPVPAELPRLLKGRKVLGLSRRAKYLIFDMGDGFLILHLGMSGRLRIVDQGTAVQQHDHLDFRFSTGKTLRYTDPRRFGAVLWTESAIEQHPLFRHLGPEPLTADFDGEYLFQRSRRRRIALKSFIMDSSVVVGVGNIYANEALFLSGIRPGRAAGRISRAQYQRLAEQIKAVLTKAIAVGGTTLRDFVGSDGRPGYFKQELFVYGRSGEACLLCQALLKSKRLAQRQTVYCANCQR